MECIQRKESEIQEKFAIPRMSATALGKQKIGNVNIVQ